MESEDPVSGSPAQRNTTTVSSLQTLHICLEESVALGPVSGLLVTAPGRIMVRLTSLKARTIKQRSYLHCTLPVNAQLQAILAPKQEISRLAIAHTTSTPAPMAQ